MENKLDEIYQQYTEALTEKTEMDAQIKNLSRLVDDLNKQITEGDVNGEYGLTLTAHAANNTSKRLESLAAESSVIFRDVMNTDNPPMSLIWPSNVESFVLGMLSKARTAGEYTVEQSKNSGKSEYHYNIEVKNWNSDNKRLIFTGIVENNNIKTCFFNWVQ